MTKGTKKIKKLEVTLSAERKDNEIGKYFTIWIYLNYGKKSNPITSIYTNMPDMRGYLMKQCNDIYYRINGALFWEEMSIEMSNRIPGIYELESFIIEFINNLDWDNSPEKPFAVLSK